MKKEHKAAKLVHAHEKVKSDTNTAEPSVCNDPSISKGKPLKKSCTEADPCLDVIPFLFRSLLRVKIYSATPRWVIIPGYTLSGGLITSHTPSFLYIDSKLIFLP